MRRIEVLVLAALIVVTGCKAPLSPPVSQSDSRQTQAADGLGRRADNNTAYGNGNEHRRDNSRRGARETPPGQFDYYLLTLSWSPEFCYTHPQAAECAQRPRFIVHGLWPENNDGSYPEHCSETSGPANPGQYSDMYPDQSLLAHEWTTHGTCSGLSADAYFHDIRSATHAIRIPGELASVSRQITLSPDEIVTAFTQANPGIRAEDLTVGCGNNFLTQVQVCLDKNLLPTACQGVRSCRANVVKVTPPGATRQGRNPN